MIAMSEGNMLKAHSAIYSIRMKYVLKWTLLLIYYPYVRKRSIIDATIGGYNR